MSGPTEGATRSRRGSMGWFWRLGARRLLRHRTQIPGPDVSQGPFIFQCKFVDSANASGARPLPSPMTALEKESRRIDARRTQLLPRYHEPRSYVLLTNVVLAGASRSKVTERMRLTFPSDVELHVQDGTDICAWLDWTLLATSFAHYRRCKVCETSQISCENGPCQTYLRGAALRLKRLHTWLPFSFRHIPIRRPSRH
jgi:hypothetical protein